MHRLRGTVAGPALAVGLAAVLAACGGPGATRTPSPQPTAAATFAPPSIDVEDPGLTPAAGQVDTEWGPIWETLPASFPVPPGAVPADPEAGPVSGAWTIPGASPAEARATAGFYGDAFSAIGYGGGVDGPLEDGSFTTWASNGYGCDILVTVLPRGEAERLVTVLYGAGCPFDWAGT